jgi:predicted alpha/beta hydrolase family esterase
VALTYVIVPGIGNSPAEHWQSRWSSSLQPLLRVEQNNWTIAIRDAWVSAFERTLRAVQGPKLVVAHSLGCLLAAEAAPRLESLGVVAAFLVAVPDVDGPRFPRSALKFRSALRLDLPVPSLLVGSTNDPYSEFAHAESVAQRWGSTLVNVGARGHINLEPDVGDWPEGRALLTDFAARSDSLDSARAADPARSIRSMPTAHGHLASKTGA